MLKAAFHMFAFAFLRVVIPRSMNMSGWTQVTVEHLAKTAHQNL